MADMYYYNGVLLPEIPADVLAKYPYCCLVDSQTLYASAVQAYFYATESVPSAYKCDGAAAIYNMTDGEWVLDDEYLSMHKAITEVLWANFDMPNGSVDSTTIYFPAMKIYRAVDTFEYSTYAISSKRMTGIANQIRRMTNISGKMTPSDLQKALENMTADAVTDYMIVHETVRADEPQTIVEVTELEDAVRYYYNGVLLPPIPKDDMLSDHLYCFIRNFKSSNAYDLVFSKVPWYYNGESQLQTDVAAGDVVHWYQIPKTEAGTATVWPYKEFTESGRFNCGDRPIIWTNVTIKEVSGNGTNGQVYLQWSMPVPQKEE